MEGCGYCDLDYRLGCFHVRAFGESNEEFAPPSGRDHRLKKTSPDTAASDDITSIAEGDESVRLVTVELPAQQQRMEAIEVNLDSRGGDPRTQVDQEDGGRLEPVRRPAEHAQPWRAARCHVDRRGGADDPDFVTSLVETEPGQRGAINAESSLEIGTRLDTRPVARHGR